MKRDVYDAVWALRMNSNSAYLSYVDEAGYPGIRAMLVLEHEKIETHYFSTNTSSQKVAALRNNGKAAVYYCDPENFQGALFVGNMEVCTDAETKAFLWRDGFERYYPQGVTDPDYCVLKLTVLHGSHYHGLCNTKFTPEELNKRE